MTTHLRPRLAVSSCLLGAPVRYNGGHSRDRFLTDQLAPHVDWVPVCPEMEIGLGAPRPTLRLLTDGRLVSGTDDRDHGAAMARLAQTRIPDFTGLDGYILKSRSPSCGLTGLPRYASGRGGERTDGQPVDRAGRGAWARLVLDALPHLPVEEEGRLRDPVLREHFVERVFAHARLREFFDGDWTPGGLVDFHSRHKLQILAHDPDGYRRMGRIVAQAGVRDRRALEAEYRRAFNEILAIRAGRGRHENALLHVLGPMSNRLDRSRRHDIVATIEAYRRGETPLSVPIALLRHDAEGVGHDYLARQTYLDPFPADLVPRHHV